MIGTAGEVRDFRLAADTLRCLVMDMVERAHSGHPGGPMGMADFATVLFLKHLRYNPLDPSWVDRDRLVLSAGHASAMLYALWHLAGYNIKMDDLKAFRQWGSRTPGHPEYGLTPGVETTTGPLGQGCANGVGMALAEAMLAARFNKRGFDIVDHHTYVIAGDGDMMEGLSHEAFALAGHLGLNKLIVIYDANHVTIEGPLSLAASEDTGRRFEAYGWFVQEIDGHEYAEIDTALRRARFENARPSLIIARTHIGMGSPGMRDSAACHGAPLGEEEVRAAKKELGFPPERKFHVPAEVYEIFARRNTELIQQHGMWATKVEEYRRLFTALSEEWDSYHAGDYSGVEDALEELSAAGDEATRKTSGRVLQVLAERFPNLVGGSADLGPSNNTYLKGYDAVGPHSFSGRNFHFGVREHAMAGIMNGMALHGGLRPYGGTFLVFADYMRPAIRMAAMMKLPVIYVFSHDSIFIGEDGPTHQPVEQLASLRCIPNLVVIRPADAVETVAAWRAAMMRTDGPTALILTRQVVSQIPREESSFSVEQLVSGYILWQGGGDAADIVLLASGSELAVTLDAGKRLAEDGWGVKVVSLPSWELFEDLPEERRKTLLESRRGLRLAIEAGCRQGWERFIGDRGRMLGVDTFGHSAPWRVLAEKYGFTTDNIYHAARALLQTAVEGETRA